MSLEIVSDSSNELLERREVICRLYIGSGSLKRGDAIKAVAKALNVKADNVILTKLANKTGTPFAQGTFYIYNDMKEAKRQVPKYIFERMGRETAKVEKEKKAKPSEPKESKK